jgi:hypothetical protein
VAAWSGSDRAVGVRVYMRTRTFAFIVFIVAVAIAVAAVGLTVFRPSGEGPVLRSTPSVVTEIRDLARLESVQYHIERVVDLRDQQSLLFGLIHTQDAILFVAVGDVVAGVDLSEMADGDVIVDTTTGKVSVTLPPAQILSTRLDNQRSWVYSRTTDLLAQRHEDLETRARQEAERTLEGAAIAAGVLDRARANAEQTVATLVRSLGYTTVVVTSRDQP